MDKTYYLVLRMGTSKGRETFGYITCSLRNAYDMKRVGYCNGGGYDMIGTVFGQWMLQQFGAELAAIPDSEYPDLYGMGKHNGKVWLDGACGFESMRKILGRLGYTIETITYLKHGDERSYRVHKQG